MVDQPLDANNHPLQLGQRVRALKPAANELYKGAYPAWIEELDEFVGQEFVITQLAVNSPGIPWVATLDHPGRPWVWRTCWLEGAPVARGLKQLVQRYQEVRSG